MVRQKKRWKTHRNKKKRHGKAMEKRRKKVSQLGLGDGFKHFCIFTPTWGNDRI